MPTPVATVTKDPSAEREQWLWAHTALKRPKGWRKGAGHRTSWIDARRAAEEYWAKWLEEAALRDDVMRLASLDAARRHPLASLQSPRKAPRYRRCVVVLSKPKALSHSPLHHARGPLLRVEGDQGREGQAALCDRHEGRLAIRARRPLGELERPEHGRVGEDILRCSPRPRTNSWRRFTIECR